MQTHRRTFVLTLVFGAVATAAVAATAAGCAYETAEPGGGGGDGRTAEGTPALDPDPLRWPPAGLAVEPRAGDDGAPPVTPVPPAGEPDAVEPPVDFEAAVVTGRDLRELVHVLVRRAIEAPRTEPHEMGEHVDAHGFRGTVWSASDGFVQVARLRLVGRMHGRRLEVHLGWSDWGDGQLFDGTITHRDMEIELYDILQRDPDGTIRVGIEDAWTVQGARYALRHGSIVVSPSASDDPGERTVAADGELVHEGEVVGGLVADDDRVVLEGPEGDVTFAEI